MVDLANIKLPVIDANGVDVAFCGGSKRGRKGRRSASRQSFQFGRAAAVRIECFGETRFAACDVAGHRDGIYAVNERGDLRSLVGGESQIPVAADVEREAAMVSAVHVERAAIEVDEIEVYVNKPSCYESEYDFDLLAVECGKCDGASGGDVEAGAVDELVVEFAVGGVDDKVIARMAEFGDLAVTGVMKAASFVPFGIPHGDKAGGDVGDGRLDETDAFGDYLHDSYAPCCFMNHKSTQICTNQWESGFVKISEDLWYSQPLRSDQLGFSCGGDYACVDVGWCHAYGKGCAIRMSGMA